MSGQLNFAAKKNKAVKEKVPSKANNDQKPKAQPSTSTVTQVILTSHNNFVQWNDTSEICMTQKHGMLATIYSTSKNFEHERPRRPEESVYRGAIKDEYLEDYRNWKKEMSILKEKSALFFGDMMQQLNSLV